MTDVTVVLEGGGMRNALTNAVLLKFREYGFKPANVNAVYACSSAAPLAAYFISDRLKIGLGLWTERLIDPDIFKPSRILRLGRPSDIDALVDDACASIPKDAISDTALIINIVRESDGKAIYVTCDNSDIRQVLKATCALPLLTRKVMYRDEHVLDGGLVDPLPILRAYEDGCRKFLVISNRPSGHIPLTRLETTLAKITYRGNERLRDAILAMRDRYMRSMEFISDPPSDVKMLMIAPDAVLPVTRLCRNRDKIFETIRIGEAKALRMRDTLHAFLL